ncbi:hypothetical protein [Frankia sp. Cas3]|uniref:hypothetical protein n=1 Tax=Frankia sp. Cas3 TaxID=3073926 RepID=UPI002AD51F4F|nr:hypothetical protein [Frankia sp. Cas3]
MSRRVATGDPNPATLDELESDVDEVATIYPATPHAVLGMTLDRYEVLHGTDSAVYTVTRDEWAKRSRERSRM